MKKQRGVEVFILRERGESAKTWRYTRRGHAKPNGARRRPEGERAPLSPGRTLLNNISPIR